MTKKLYTFAAFTLLSIMATCTAAAAQHTVKLTWGASSDTAVSKYTVYRGTTSGGPYNLVTPICTTTGTAPALTCTDANVTNGTTYYYVATAFDATDTGKSPSTGTVGESAFSNEASAVIPVPVIVTPAPGTAPNAAGLATTVQ